MGFLKRISSLLSPEPAGEAEALWVYVRCNRCGEKIRTRIDLRYDPTPQYDEEGNVTGYFLRKELIGSRGCFQPIEVKLTFDARRNVTSREISGGEFITREEYESEGAS